MAGRRNGNHVGRRCIEFLDGDAPGVRLKRKRK
jgi:hypothetical protein